MSPDIKKRSLIAAAVAALLVSACSSTPDEPEAPAETVTAPPVTQTAPVEAPPVAQPAQVQPAPREPVRLSPSAPDRYVVKKGDTLWDISAMFLKDPWYWPEIWYVNPQVENPHLIYPGDVLRLVYVDGQPRIILERGDVVRLSPRVRAYPLEEAISTIPYEAIRPFLSSPSILDKDTAKNAPYILASRHGQLIHGEGTPVYARGGDLPVGGRYTILHVGDELEDPETGKSLGYEGTYVGEGRVDRGGDPVTLMLTETTREALNGDRLLPSSPDIPMHYMPRRPDSEIKGRIVSVVDGVSIIGTYQIVVLNRGAADGLQPGHVLDVYQRGDEVRDRWANRGSPWNPTNYMFREKVQLPAEYSGNLMVFRVFDDISYGLIMQATSEIFVNDIVRTPR